jgi:hypothetical protein
MKRLLLVALMVLLGGIVYLAMFPVGQQPDRAFDTRVSKPAWVDRHPVILFDEAHYNAHTLDGNFAPFGALLRNDGYVLRTNRQPFTQESPADVRVLVIVNAAGGSNPKLFGFNLVPLRKGQRDAAAFTANEIETVRRWVANGGSLLLVADHYPFGSAASGLAAAFGVRMHGGYAQAANQYAGQDDPGSIRFSRRNQLLADHAITAGRGTSERVNEVMSFTGQSLDGPDGSALLRLPSSAVEYVPPPPHFKEQPAGNMQAAALEYERGRLVVLGEAGMLTAQVDDGTTFGMNVPGVDNRQFTLNLLRWLSRLL